MDRVWEVEAEDEVGNWLLGLSTKDLARARRALDLLRAEGDRLGMPHALSLGHGLRELRFHLRDQERRITYWITPDRRIVLLTTFRKQRQNEHREVARAHRVMRSQQDDTTAE